MSIRSAMIHGTGYTAGDLIDAAVAAAGSGGSPKPGEPTRFLSLTYHHPGNEDGTSVSATTGIPVPGFVCQEGEDWYVSFVTISATSTAMPNEYGSAWNYATELYRPHGANMGPVPGQAASDITLIGSMPATSGFADDPQMGGRVVSFSASNDIRAIIHGMSTNTPTDWTINVQLTPLAP